MQKQRLIFLIVGIILGLVAVVMVNAYIKDMDENNKRQAAKALEKMRQNQTVVLVAKQDIPAETVIQGTMLETTIVPREYVQPQAATSLDSIGGMVTIAPIARGEQIGLNKLAAASSQLTKKRDLSSITPIGKRAVGVAPENINEVIGLLKPGDSVDLIAALPVPQESQDGKKSMQQTIVPVFQNVLVLAVGQELDPKAISAKGLKDRDKPTHITVALDPTEANMLTFLQEQGKIRVSLRSSQDSQIENIETVTWKSILEKIPALRPEDTQGETIDIYRGLKKEKIPISQ